MAVTLTPTHWTWLIGSPLLMLLGSVGNLLVIVVMRRKVFAKDTMTIFLIALAVADTTFLISGLVRQWLRFLANIDVRTLSEASCKFHTFVVYCTSQYASWIIVFMTLERFCSVWFHQKAKVIFSKRNALLMLAVSLVTLSAINVPWALGQHLSAANLAANSSIVRCVSVSGTYYKTIWPWIDYCLFSIFPFTILLSCNVGIIARVLYSQYKTRKPQKVEGSNSNAKKINSMTAILLLVSLTFFVTTSPSSIYLIVNPVDSSGFGWAVVNMIMYLNNSVNFILYFMAGPRFRAELKKMFRCKHHSVHPASDTTDTTA